MFTITLERKAVTDEIEARMAEVLYQNCKSLPLHCKSFIKQRKIKITISEHSICPEFQHQVSFTGIQIYDTKSLCWQVAQP